MKCINLPRNLPSDELICYITLQYILSHFLNPPPFLWLPCTLKQSDNCWQEKIKPVNVFQTQISPPPPFSSETASQTQHNKDDDNFLLWQYKMIRSGTKQQNIIFPNRVKDAQYSKCWPLGFWPKQIHCISFPRCYCCSSNHFTQGTQSIRCPNIYLNMTSYIVPIYGTYSREYYIRYWVE